MKHVPSIKPLTPGSETRQTIKLINWDPGAPEEEMVKGAMSRYFRVFR